MRRHFSKVGVTVTLPPQPKIQGPVPQLSRFQRLWPSPSTFRCAGSLRLRNGCQVWAWRSSGEGQGQRGQKSICLSIVFFVCLLCLWVVGLSVKKGPSEGKREKRIHCSYFHRETIPPTAITVCVYCSTALVVKLLVIEQLMLPALKSTVSEPWQCPSLSLLATNAGDATEPVGSWSPVPLPSPTNQTLHKRYI